MSWNLEAEHAFGPDSIVRRYRAPSGLAVIALRDPGAPIFSYQTWFRVGSRHERPGRTGIAHWFEHLMFNRTESTTTGEIDRRIEGVGGDTNAATWVDWTYYRDNLPASAIELAVSIESDRMQHLVLEPDELESEREVVINERLERVEDDVDGFLSEQLFAIAFDSHPYRWPTIGWMDDIRALTEHDARRFYDTFYTPNNATIVCVGDVDTDRLLALVDRYYGAIPPAALPEESTAPEPEQTAERTRSFTKPVSSDRVLFGYKSPAQGHPDWAVLEFIDTLLTGGPSARLYRELVVDNELATTVDGGLMPFAQPGLYELSISMMRGVSADRARDALDAHIDRLQREPVSDAEIEKIKNCVETDFWSSLVHAEGKAEALGHYEVTLGDFRALFDMAERLHDVTADDIQRVARAYLRPERRTVVVAEPEERE